MTSQTPGPGGELALLIQQFAWSRTSVGDRQHWSPSLRATVDMMLAAPLAMVLMWGRDHAMIYNAGYAKIAGSRHPRALGSTLQEVWPELWDWYRPVLAACLAGESQTFSDARFLLERDQAGNPEEMWLDLFYSPVPDGDGKIGGVMCIMVETTARVRSGREKQRAETDLLKLNQALEMERQAVIAANRRLINETGFLRELFEQAPSFIAVLRGPEHIFELANPSYMRLVGNRELIGKSVLEGVPESNGQGFIEVLDTVYRTGESFVGKNFKLAVRAAPDQPFEQRIVNFVYQPIKNAAGQVEGIFVEGIDITEQATTEERLRVAQRAGGVGTFEWFPVRGDIVVSDEYRRIWGFESDLPVTPQLIVDSVDPRDRGTLGPARWGEHDNPLSYTEYRITRRNDGEQRWIARRGEVIQQDPRLGPRYVGAVIDITERKRVEDDLRESERRASALFGQASVGMAEFDVKGCCLRINDAMCRMFGRSHEDLMAVNFIKLIYPDDLAIDMPLILAMLESEHSFVVEQSYVRPDESLLWTSNNVSRIVDEQGRTKTMIVVTTDISERREAEKRLRELNETLEQRVSREVTARGKAEETLRHMQKMDAIGQLTGGVAHDFNNVLQIISANLQLLQARVANEASEKKRIDTAISAVERGARLSSHLLAFARRQPLKPKVLNLRHRLSEMNELMRRSLGEAIDIETEIDGNLWNTLVDPGQLETVVLNIALNARDAMDGVGKLTIKVENLWLDENQMLNEAEVPAGEYLLLSISDTGSGMTPEIAARAFEPFFTTKGEGQGTGLGLSMAYGFVRQSHGFIALCSEAGKGTTVKIYLPRSLEQETPPATGPEGPLVGGNETILVVEDDPDVSASVTDMLTILGYRVLNASNAADALTILQSDAAIDMLFTDVIMPGPVRSPEMAREARRLRPDLAVLFTSGYTQDAFDNGGLLNPGLELISKPYRIEELGRKIRELLPAPAQPPGQTAPAQDAPENAPPVSGASRILVVEDNPDAQFLVCEMLMALGYEAEGTTNAEEALARLAEQRFRLLFTDVNLPGMSGVDLARQAVSDDPQLKVVFASGYGAGTSKYVDFPSVSLPKPYDFQQLEDALQKLGI